MRNLLVLAILVVAGYYAYTELLPRYEAHKVSREAGAQAQDDNARARICIAAAESFRRDLGREANRLSRPGAETGTWSTLMVQLSGDLSGADSACNCPTEACVSAAGALFEMRRLLGRLDAVARRKAESLIGHSGALQRVDGLLARARSEAG